MSGPKCTLTARCIKAIVNLSCVSRIFYSSSVPKHFMINFQQTHHHHSDSCMNVVEGLTAEAESLLAPRGNTGIALISGPCAFSSMQHRCTEGSSILSIISAHCLCQDIQYRETDTNQPRIHLSTSKFAMPRVWLNSSLALQYQNLKPRSRNLVASGTEIASTRGQLNEAPPRDIHG
ncbi:hypothetical protein NA56DRAFT_709692 [Hyaloscypha hepaticicola]|uniref:Uncharacterized protein n=1 Tax=Hyaloscypha hepaticicola TaxID=2082293 RepID=A0A2J6PNE6_9HELO|nr:hypothetical protein NA56DRAFT_709692 [Hyaloscypha hepaticicola]